MGLLARSFDLVRTFSRGMAQRLGLARVLLHEPRLLLLDEPYAGLDAAGAHLLDAVLADAVRDRGVVMVTHEVERGVALAGRLLVLRAGRTVLSEPTGARRRQRLPRALRGAGGVTAARPAWPRQLRALLLKDLRLELRTRDTIVAMVLFAVLAMLIFQFAFGNRGDDLTPYAGGILWATLSLTAVLGVGRSWVPEREQGVLDGILSAPVPRLVLLVSKAGAIYAYLLAVEIVAVPLVALFFVRGSVAADLGLIALTCLLANLGIAILGSLYACLALFARARELLLPVLFLPSLLPVVIAAAGAVNAVAGGTNDLSEYRGYSLFLAVYAVIFGLVAYATYDHVFDD